jgi:hypothetical protein
LSDASQLQLILAKDAGGDYQLYACRGEGKGCARNKYRASKKPCSDCIGPLDENLTVGDVVDMLKRGDA